MHKNASKNDNCTVIVLTECLNTPQLFKISTQYVLRPYIVSEINHKRNSSIEMPFINKLKEWNSLVPSIFKDRSVTSAVPAYFKSTEAPIICYKYIKPIRSTVFHFNKVVSGPDS